jgi:hypothetical protein
VGWAAWEEWIIDPFHAAHSKKGRSKERPFFDIAGLDFENIIDTLNRTEAMRLLEEIQMQAVRGGLNNMTIEVVFSINFICCPSIKQEPLPDRKYKHLFESAKPC